ncbi:hypothetical protein [Natrialba asiatica]|uniref:Glycoside hydrolase family protein n=1 Tax=Natrialba asiatica (strain ATCC 700177 / DSM 12278 / JCM 9576 / FERM P-10747 / NBRC 102637 / 172P1) TaxID=29540 RepID=M0AR41_NATA1|nr:hypothetical protein [Natrialba asiatica]ELZ00797.1 hypothetical protein C481_11200 [Natrialba asiatica DSM 12278]
MYGVVTRNAEEVQWPEFDRGFYEVKDVTGRSAEPIADGVNMVSCFGDNAAADADPSLVPVDDMGRPATRDRRYFDWAYICPSREDYREGLFEIIDDCVEANEDVRLDDVGFPRPEYCRCGVCERAFAESEYEERNEWRASVITEFVADAADRIPGRVYLTLYPDPYPGHLYERAGLDLAALEDYVDEFVVPLYDTAYETTYWLETIAKGFESELETPFSIELYAVNVEVENLIRALEVAEHYGESVLFGYEASNARAALRRRRADERDGVSHGEPE